LKTGVQTPAGAGTEFYFQFRLKIPIYLHTLTTVKKPLNFNAQYPLIYIPNVYMTFVRNVCVYIYIVLTNLHIFKTKPLQLFTNKITFHDKYEYVAKCIRMRWAGNVARMCERRAVYMVLVGTPEGKRPLGRPKRRWEVNIKMDLQKMGCDVMDWIDLIQDRDRWRVLVHAVMNIWVPYNTGNFLTS
jgi:hypothetical protein